MNKKLLEVNVSRDGFTDADSFVKVAIITKGSLSLHDYAYHETEHFDKVFTDAQVVQQVLAKYPDADNIFIAYQKKNKWKAGVVLPKTGTRFGKFGVFVKYNYGPAQKLFVVEDCQDMEKLAEGLSSIKDVTNVYILLEKNWSKYHEISSK